MTDEMLQNLLVEAPLAAGAGRSAWTPTGLETSQNNAPRPPLYYNYGLTTQFLKLDHSNIIVPNKYRGKRIELQPILQLYSLELE